ncbi:MAG TPA: hypothetical protein VGR57_14130 [Ktedonobacterales bacterium]|nr:hypothetical protein [Ktedonobacterales bacterium]
MSPMQQTPQRLRRIQYVTRHFQELQGLRYVPFAIAGTAAALLAGGGIVEAVAGIVLLGASIGLGPLIASYYARTYGRVTPSHGGAARGRAVGIATVVAIGLLFVTLRQLSPNQSGRLYVEILTLAAALVLLVGFGRGERLLLRPYWAVMGAALLLFNLVLLFLAPGSLPAPFGATGLNALTLLYLAPLALALAIGGVLDHLLLLRTFAPREAVQ